MQVQATEVDWNLPLQLVRVQLVPDEAGAIFAKGRAPDTRRDQACGDAEEGTVGPVACKAADKGTEALTGRCARIECRIAC